MVTHPGAASFVPDTASLSALADAARDCRGCDLREPATQTVFGSGDASAVLALVGEQPGDQEDRQGEPFVGPAGRLLDRAVADAGLADVPTWTTNAVKHFRFRAGRGTQRLHQTPTAGQSTACRPWLAAELATVAPRVVVALGATAAHSLLGPSFRLTEQRGATLAWPPESGSFAGSSLRFDAVFATIHPSAVLRAPDEERAAAFDGLVRDLRAAATVLFE